MKTRIIQGLVSVVWANVMACAIGFAADSVVLSVPLTVASAGVSADWLLNPAPYKAKVTRNEGTGEVALENGLVRRVIRTKNGCASIALDNLMTDGQMLRSARPEALVELDGRKYPVGGLDGQPVHNYLDPKWLEKMTPTPGAFTFEGLEIGQTKERFPWKKRLEWMPRDLPWPPPGASLTLHFNSFRVFGDVEKTASAASSGGVMVDVHYEIYDGIPLIGKWITVRNGGKSPVRLNSFTAEILAAVESESSVEPNPAWEHPGLHIETDYAFLSMSIKGANATVNWGPDPLYATQVNYERKTPCLLECRPPIGPDQELAPGAEFESFRVFELIYDSTDRERNSLAQRRMYRTIAPWVTENPILMHVRNADPDSLRRAVDQCADVGFELIIMTFGSGFNFESRDPAYQAKIKSAADYARSKGIALGGYSLLASRGAGVKEDNTQGSPPRFGVMPCLGAKWGMEYLVQLKNFMANAGLGVLEHDGSYPGDCCASTKHPGHRGLNDSQWVMWKAITDLYKWCRANGVYLNIPDWYFLTGGSKTGMGYRETNWSLPREYQEIIERQNIFDGTWEKTPSMGWMFVPLTVYHGGGAAATIEPLKDHLPHYGQRLANLFGAGVQACYRGPRLYDAPETRALVKQWVDFYKKHRAILDSDILHLRRADGRDLDYILHVNPDLKERGLLMVYNPLESEVRKTLRIPLYYTGLTQAALVSEQDQKAVKHPLDPDCRLTLPVTIPARGVTWFVIGIGG
ncbi:MAG: hypothetical protein NTX50_21675 [Candidatus Sumerlaeota bacterium]|nr:hypothetical protein [Candidatus Sumerlaeota bacterium]